MLARKLRKPPGDSSLYQPVCHNENRRCFLNAAMLSAALITPMAIAPTALRAEDHKTYHDKQHNDDH